MGEPGTAAIFPFREKCAHARARAVVVKNRSTLTYAHARHGMRKPGRGRDDVDVVDLLLMMLLLFVRLPATTFILLLLPLLAGTSQPCCLPAACRYLCMLFIYFLLFI